MRSQTATSLRVEPLCEEREFRAAADLYARAFGYDRPEFSLNPNLLTALAKNGGSAVGVSTADGELVGFAYGFSGRDESGDEYHYSQAAVVDPAHQGRGIGRLLKLGQRDIALGWGHRTMRWTFDPLVTRNAHFNFSTLGAEGIGYDADYYLRPGTDRVVVDWRLDRQDDPYAVERGAVPPALGRADWGRLVSMSASTAVAGTGDAVWLAVPAGADGLAAASDEAHAAADPLRARVRMAMVRLVAGGHVFVACRAIDSETAVYLAVRRREEGGAR